MVGTARAYSCNQGGVLVEDSVCGFNIVVHRPANSAELERRVAQAHADAIIVKVKKMTCSAEQKEELIDAICTT